MKKSRYTEQQIIQVLRRYDSGEKVRDLVREVGITESTFYLWRKKYGGLAPSELKKIRQQEDEILRLKRMVADLMLDKQMLQDVIEKKL